jgi:hypothetical protein
MTGGLKYFTYSVLFIKISTSFLVLFHLQTQQFIHMSSHSVSCTEKWHEILKVLLASLSLQSLSKFDISLRCNNRSKLATTVSSFSSTSSQTIYWQRKKREIFFCVTSIVRASVLNITEPRRVLPRYMVKWPTLMCVYSHNAWATQIPRYKYRSIVAKLISSIGTTLYGDSLYCVSVNSYWGSNIVQM